MIAKVILLQELVNRSDFESKKLDLMSEVSTMKLKYASLEREKLDTERKLRLSKVCVHMVVFSLDIQ
jgi:hypothetical protein